VGDDSCACQVLTCFTCFTVFALLVQAYVLTGTKVQILTPAGAVSSMNTSGNVESGSRFTCFTRTKVQILTQLLRGIREHFFQGAGRRRYRGRSVQVCSRMLTYAHVCSRMLTYAGRRRYRGRGVQVLSRMLTYADVC
jgi:hypothetical protein